jgi:HEAT repeat protein
VTDDPATEPRRTDRGAAQRRRRVIAAGHAGEADRARAALTDADPEVQAAALGALARCGTLGVGDIATALTQGPVAVRRRAADLSRTVHGPGSRSTLVRTMVGALADPDPLVVVQAAWFLGERRARAGVAELTRTARTHDDMRCREAAVAALGTIGDQQGLDAVLEALDDKPTVRRRATVALAGFADQRVDEALRRSQLDRDWQVRQAADELLDD